jgi:hypothetical protein
MFFGECGAHVWADFMDRRRSQEDQKTHEEDTADDEIDE